MFSSFISRNLAHSKSTSRFSPTCRFYFHQSNPFPVSSSSATPKSISEASGKSSFTVSYLVNTHGFSPERALSASRYLNLESSDKPKSVVAFFEKHGFTEKQIISLVRKHPPVLLSNPEKSCLPKLNFLQSKGLSSKDIAKIVSSTPEITRRSLKNKIIPSFEYIKNLLKSEEKAIHAIKRFGTLLVCDLSTYLAANIDAMREVGVPESNILAFLVYQPGTFITNAEKFKESLNEVLKMGFDPERLNFVLAIHSLRAMSKLTWNKKVEAYKKWGWSEDDVLMAFRIHPGCMIASEDKIEKTMDFFVNKMGWDSSVFAKRPSLIFLSLEKRIIPRCAVYQFLLSKGLISKGIRARALLDPSEKCFLDKFLKRYEEKAPEVLEIYQAKLTLSK